MFDKPFSTSKVVTSFLSLYPPNLSIQDLSGPEHLSHLTFSLYPNYIFLPNKIYKL